MNPEANPDSPQLPVYEAEEGVAYSLEIIASLSGVDTATILRYQEEGLIGADYNDESLRRIRCIRHVETEYAAGPSALRLILNLFDEVESLRDLLRRL